MRKLLWLLWLVLLGVCDDKVTPHMALNCASHDTTGWNVLPNNNFTALDTFLGGLAGCNTNQAAGFNGAAWMCAAFPTGLPSVVPRRSHLVSNGVGQPGVYQTKPVLDARDFSGANAGAQIQAAHDSSNCPSTGCVIDARGFGATDTISGLAITKPIKVIFGATNFRVSGTNTFTDITGGEIEGAGIGVTVFSWAGSSSSQMFRLISVARSSFHGFSMAASTTLPLTSFFTSERGASGNPTNNVFYDIQGDGTNGGVKDAFHWVIGAGGDAGNDAFVFRRVNLYNYSNSAWNSSGSTQSQTHSFYSCQAGSNGYGNYGYYGVGSFSMFNMVFSSNKISDITISNINNGVLISGGISIGSNRFYIDGSSSNSFTATIQGVNFAATGLNADGKVMVLGQRGPYLIINNQVTASSSLPAQFYYRPSGLAANAIAIGNNILTNLSAPFTGGPWQLIGNSINTGAPALVPDVFPNGLNGTAYVSAGTTFTSTAGCSETSLTGGATAGFFLAGATNCTTTVKMGHSATAPNGWACSVWDTTTTADVMKETASTTTTVTFSGTVAPSDKIIFGCIGF